MEKVGIPSLVEVEQELKEKIIESHIRCDKRAGEFRRGWWYSRREENGSISLITNGKVLRGNVREGLSRIFEQKEELKYWKNKLKDSDMAKILEIRIKSIQKLGVLTPGKVKCLSGINCIGVRGRQEQCPWCKQQENWIYPVKCFKRSDEKKLFLEELNLNLQNQNAGTK